MDPERLLRAHVKLRREEQQSHSRGSNVCWTLCLSLSFSFLIKFSSTSFPSSTRKPPLELTIFDRSYSKYVPSIVESRWRGRSRDRPGAVGELDVAGVTPKGLLLFAFGWDEDEFSCSRWRWVAFAILPVIMLWDIDFGDNSTFQTVYFKSLSLFGSKGQAWAWCTRRSKTSFRHDRIWEDGPASRGANWRVKNLSSGSVAVARKTSRRRK